MAKRSIDVRDSIVEDTPIVIELDTPEYVLMVLLKDVKLKITGAFTGVEYVWGGAGSSNYVDTRDADVIIQKAKQRESCCGSQTSKYFEVRR